METKASIWKGVKKSEKFSLLSLAILGLCIVALVTIIVVRPF